MEKKVSEMEDKYKKYTKKPRKHEIRKFCSMNQTSISKKKKKLRQCRVTVNNSRKSQIYLRLGNFGFIIFVCKGIATTRTSTRTSFDPDSGRPTQ